MMSSGGHQERCCELGWPVGSTICHHLCAVHDKMSKFMGSSKRERSRHPLSARVR